jgi:hypothetical protein
MVPRLDGGGRQLRSHLFGFRAERVVPFLQGDGGVGVDLVGIVVVVAAMSLGTALIKFDDPPRSVGATDDLASLAVLLERFPVMLDLRVVNDFAVLCFFPIKFFLERKGKKKTQCTSPLPFPPPPKKKGDQDGCKRDVFLVRDLDGSLLERSESKNVLRRSRVPRSQDARIHVVSRRFDHRDESDAQGDRQQPRSRERR